MSVLLMMGVALAATYEVEIAVPAQGFIPTSNTLVSGRIFKGIAAGHEDVEVASTSPYVSCSIKGGDVRAVVRFDADPWPTLPVSADCVYGEDTLRVFPVLDGLQTAWLESDRYIVPHEPVVIRRAPNEQGFKFYLLPEGGTYEEAANQAMRTDGSPWEGLSCVSKVSSEGTWWLQVRVDDPQLAYGEGGCEINNPGGLPYQLRLSVTE